MRVAQRFDEPLLVPGKMRSQSFPPGAGLVLEPVHLVYELSPELLGYDLHARQAAQHIGLPLRVRVLQEPLVPHHHDHAARAAAADDRRLGKLIEDLGHALLDQIGQENVLDLADGNARVAAGVGLENAVMKLAPVDHLGGLFRLGVVLVLDLQLVRRFHRRKLPVAGRLNQGDELDGPQVLGDAVLERSLSYRSFRAR